MASAGGRYLRGARRKPDVFAARGFRTLGHRERLFARKPYEWYGDNFIAYVVTVIEEQGLASLSADSNATMAAKIAIDQALRAIWPGFYHRNLAPEVRAYFERTFPISESDRHALSKRYIDPIIESS